MAAQFSTEEVVDMMLTLEAVVDQLITEERHHMAFEVNSVLTRLNNRLWGVE